MAASPPFSPRCVVLYAWRRRTEEEECGEKGRGGEDKEKNKRGSRASLSEAIKSSTQREEESTNERRNVNTPAQKDRLGLIPRKEAGQKMKCFFLLRCTSSDERARAKGLLDFLFPSLLLCLKLASTRLVME